MKRSRSRARAWVLQMLYAWDVRAGAEPIEAVRREFFENRRISEASRAYIGRLTDVLAERRAGIDDAVEACLTNWRMERLAVIDRNVLRIAAAEILFMPDVPPRVAIQEAIYLAEKYGTADSPRFVNGVLDALMRRAQPAARDS